MQNNEPSTVDISQLTWAEVEEHLQDSLNEGFKPDTAPSLDLVMATVGDMAAKLFKENPNIAERDMIVRHKVDIHHPGELDDPNDALFFLVQLFFSYVTCAEDDGGEEVTLVTEFVSIPDAICIAFDPEDGYEVEVSRKALRLPLLKEDACVNVLSGGSISDYVDMLEDAFVASGKNKLHCLPDSVGARIAVEYCDEIGCDVEVTDDEGDEA